MIILFVLLFIVQYEPITFSYWEDYSPEQQQAIIESPDLSPVIREYANQPCRVKDDNTFFLLAKELSDMNKQESGFRALYFNLFNELIVRSDGAIGEVLCDYVAKVVEEQPAYVFDYLQKHADLSSQYQDLLAEYYYFHEEKSIRKDNEQVKRLCAGDDKSWIDGFYKEILRKIELIDN